MSARIDAERPRVIVTTDLEVDDMNSLIHLALYLNLFDVEAFVYTASQYHFLGDGEHTLGEVTPHWRTKGRRAYEWRPVPHEPDPEAGRLMRYRPFPEGWMERLWLEEYAEAWPRLNENAAAAGEPAFPAPADLVRRTYVGNVAFEGDVRHDTEGSDAIRRAILDDDPRTLWLLSWGGMNTVVRALMSIAEEYSCTPSWEQVRGRVYRKVRVLGVTDGVGQDNSWLDHGATCYPDLVFWRVPYVYGSYLDAVSAQPDSIELFRAPWPKRMLIDGNGPLMARYMLYGDGKVYEGETERFQFGRHATLDWGFEGMDPIVFTPGDAMAEGDSMTYIPLLPFGLRGTDDPSFDTLLGPMFRDGEEPPAASGASSAGFGSPVEKNVNPYLRAYQEDFAARAQWCAHGSEACNHASIVDEVSEDVVALPGESVRLRAAAHDPDGDEVFARWFVAPGPTSYAGSRRLDAWGAEGFEASFAVPADAVPGERFVLTLAVRDAARRPMTRYAQVAVAVA